MPSLSLSIIMVYILYNAFQMLDYNFCFISFNFYDCNKTDMFLYYIILSKGINLNNLLLGLQKGESFTLPPSPHPSRRPCYNGPRIFTGFPICVNRLLTSTSRL